MEVESAKEVTEEASNAKQISKGAVIVAVVAGTTKYPRRERVKTKRTDSRINLSCKQYNMNFAKDDSCARKQMLKENENERLRVEQEKEAREKKKEGRTKLTGAGQQNKQEQEDSSEEDDHSNDSNSDEDVDNDNDDDDDDDEEKEEEDNVKYQGVGKNGSGFIARIKIVGKMHYHGTFRTPKEAAKAYDRAAIQAGRPTSKLNFLDQVPKDYKPKKTKLHSNNTTGYRGVCNSGKRFKAQFCQQYIGQFDTKKEAAIAFDLAAIQAKRPTSELNFPGMIHANKTKRTIYKLPITKIKKNKKKRNGKAVRQRITTTAARVKLPGSFQRRATRRQVKRY